MSRSDSVLGMSMREFIEKAAKLIVKHSERGPDFDKRIDYYADVELRDPTMPGGRHRVRVRVKVTASSLRFEEASAARSESTPPHLDR